MKGIFLVLLIFFVFFTCFLRDGLAQSIKTSRYVSATLALSHYQQDLLAQHISIRFPQSVKTIGGAVDMLLGPSGYQLVGLNRQSAPMRTILKQRLPEALRVIKNATLSECLLGLVGHSFQLLFDPVNRLISFHLKPEFEGLYSPANIEKTQEVKNNGL